MAHEIWRKFQKRGKLSESELEVLESMIEKALVVAAFFGTRRMKPLVDVVEEVMKKMEIDKIVRNLDERSVGIVGGAIVGDIGGNGDKGNGNGGNGNDNSDETKDEEQQKELAELYARMKHEKAETKD